MVRFSKLIVTAVVALNTMFAAAVFYVFLRVGSEPGVLVAAWFTFTTGELWALAIIRRGETRQGHPGRTRKE